MTTCYLVGPDVTPEHIGMVPMFLNDDDPDPAAKQLDKHYQHGGGWRPFKGHTMNKKTGSLKYPGDPELHPIAYMKLRDEMVLMYDHAWVAILQRDGSFEVCRMD